MSEAKPAWQSPYRVDCGTEEIAKRARELLPAEVEVRVVPELGSWGWLAYTRNGDGVERFALDGTGEPLTGWLRGSEP